MTKLRLITWLTMAAMLIACVLPVSVLADEAAANATTEQLNQLATTADGSAVSGMAGSRTAVLNDYTYVLLDSGSRTALDKIPNVGGDKEQLDVQDGIADLISANGSLHYLIASADGTTLIKRPETGDPIDLIPFNAAVVATQLYWYDGSLYILLDDVLNRVDPNTGVKYPVNANVKMSEFVIIGDRIYYVSKTDTSSYEMMSLSETPTALIATAGNLYAMNMDGTATERMLEVGVSNLKAQGREIVMRNYSDAYPMGSDVSQWIEGKLYTYDAVNKTFTPVGAGYDWGFYPTTQGVVVQTQNELTIYSGGVGKKLYTADEMATLSGANDTVYMFEPTFDKIVSVRPNGIAQTLSTMDGATGVISNTTPVEATTNGVTSLVDNTDNNSGTTPSSAAAASWYSENPNWSGGTANNGSSTNARPTATKKPSSSSYVFAHSDRRLLTDEELERLYDTKPSRLAYARNEILARHGYVFTTEKYKTYFADKTWYTPNSRYTNALISDLEWDNIMLIQKYEDMYNNGHSLSGDYIFHNSGTTLLTDRQVSDLKYRSPELLPYARNEILARHGYIFTTAKYRDYFNRKSWYTPNRYYTESAISNTEWKNIALIQTYENDGPLPQDKNKDHSFIFPNSDWKKLTEKQVADMARRSPEMLPYARNEIVARHGYIFSTPKYRDYFAKKAWYAPNRNYSDNMLSSVELYNAELIRSYEDGYPGGDDPSNGDNTYIFRNSGSKKLTRSQVEKLAEINPGMLAFARNEIFARRGYIFQKKVYAEYFGQKAWYRPNRNFSENMFNAAERANIKLIQEYEAIYT